MLFSDSFRYKPNIDWNNMEKIDLDEGKKCINEIAEIFDQLYLQSGMMNIFDFSHGVTQQHQE